MKKADLEKLIEEMNNDEEFAKVFDLKPMKDYPHDEILDTVHKLTLIYINVLEEKGKAYKDSWQKRGEKVSVFGNLSRKFDRIENIILDDIIVTGEESKQETLMDLANYALLWSAWRIKHYIKFKEDPDQYIKKINLKLNIQTNDLDKNED